MARPLWYEAETRIDEHTIEGPGYFRTCCPSCGCEYTFNHADFGTTVCSCEKQSVSVDCGRPCWSACDVIAWSGEHEKNVSVPSAMPLPLWPMLSGRSYSELYKDALEQVARCAAKFLEDHCPDDLSIRQVGEHVEIRPRVGSATSEGDCDDDPSVRCGDYDAVNPVQRTRPAPSTGFEQTMATRVEQALAVLKGER